MKRTSYQNGSVVRKERALGPDVWVFRYMDDGKQRSVRLGTLEKYTTKAAAEKRAVKLREEINDRVARIKVSGLCDRYARDGMPERESTSGPYRSYLKRFREEWGDHRLDEMAKDIMAIEQWLNGYQTLATPDRTAKGVIIRGRPARPASKKTKQLMKMFVHRLFELAIKWGYLTLQRNPVGLREIKGKPTRVRKLILITVDQWNKIITDPKLSPHVRVMITVAMLLGLRASELLGLRWEDIDLDNLEKWVLRVRRSYVDKDVDDTKTPDSEQELPIHDDLRLVLETWRTEQEPVNGWLFSNIQTGRPFWRGQLQKNHLVPLGNRHGIPHLGWHAFRHTYRAMMRELEIPLEMQRTLMRHSDIKTTLGYGGKTPAEVGRPSNKKVVEMLKNRA
jgi:integrase